MKKVSTVLPAKLIRGQGSGFRGRLVLGLSSPWKASGRKLAVSPEPFI